MVNILHRVTASPALDEEAMDEFRHQWHVYRKLVDRDYLSHRAVCAMLHQVIVAEVKRPFRFLDLACGDASMTVAALRDTSVSHYHGIDLSAPALASARKTTEALSCPVELEQSDFVSALRERPESTDVAWIGLSLHHLQTPDKQTLMRAIRSAVGKNGFFMIYEPFRREGESQPAYLDRFEQTNHCSWSALAPDEWASIMKHVRAADFPEPSSVWTQLGRDAGFVQVRELFTDPTGFFKVFCFRP
ncbi:MAG: class I SAM-dependent methyltransferase [Chroococcidiopsidaceae cyanobacterium CP_BM_RX_35]|nr:class I SAM-dependent methyltransferase [Chroococcidiopsidaceae cyanobacterium CP_BM_RX_35]